MNKRAVSFCLAVILAISILPVTALSAGSLSNFKKVNTYTGGMFTDIASTAWYADEVQLTYEYGLLNGKSGTTFEPDSFLKISEAIKLAACLHSIYNTGTASFAASSPWYRTYVDYAMENSIITEEFEDYEENAMRFIFADIFANALPADALSATNEIGDNMIPDVTLIDFYGADVYLLYRAGILTGSGDNHAFNPYDFIKRAEVAAITTRMASAAHREAFSMKSSLTLTASPSSVTVSKGRTTTVNITASSEDLSSFSHSYNAQMISTDSGFWDGGNTFTLIITGLSAGSTTVPVTILDENNNVLATTTISVTVTDDGEI